MIRQEFLPPRQFAGFQSYFQTIPTLADTAFAPGASWAAMVAVFMVCAPFGQEGGFPWRQCSSF